MRYTSFVDHPPTRHAILLAAFEGWNDAGEAATTALELIGADLDARVVARIDPEEFYDFQQTRPTVRTAAGRVALEWPHVELRLAHLPDDRDLLLLTGAEPNLRWRGFTQEVLDLARTMGVEKIVTVGALLADVPHTRETRVVASAVDPELVAPLQLTRSRYEGPTGILGVIAQAASTARIPSLSLWAALPHYVQATPNPRATQALIQRLAQLLEFPVETASLEDATDMYDRTVAEMVADDPELAGYVSRLEHEADEADDADDVPTAPLAELPPGQLAAEVERYLREHRGGRS